MSARPPSSPASFMTHSKALKQQPFEAIGQPTVGIDFLTKTLQLDNQTIRLQLWDTAGQQRFRSLIPGYIKDADCCLIVFDASSKQSLIRQRQSYDSIPRWIDFVKETRGPDALIYLICNKIDVETPEIDFQTVRQELRTQKINYEQVSAKIGKNILQLFRNLAKLLDKSNVDTPEEQSIRRMQLINDDSKNKPNQQSGCRC